MSENQDFHNRGGLLSFVGSVVFVTAFFIYMVVVNKGVQLDENVQEPASAGAPVYNLASEKEPWISNENIVKAGGKIFAQSCATCHGPKGDLVGGIPTARNLVEGKWTQGGGSISHYKAISNGVMVDGKPTQMVGFKSLLKPYERWALVHFIESITKSKSTDKPEDVAAFAQTAD